MGQEQSEEVKAPTDGGMKDGCNDFQQESELSLHPADASGSDDEEEIECEAPDLETAIARAIEASRKPWW